SLYISKGQLATSNAQQVLKIKRIVEELGYEVATPAQARKMLSLKGADNVGF
ncbi:MAG: 3-keto-5-aminohexanoate cleavage protein, partial [Paraglaciecola sp.]|nr:3-keto-5-aminohexanoate cleavage protein [Paraglaciecola sp.]